MTYLTPFKKAPTITITNASLSYYDSGFPWTSYYYYTLTQMNVRVSVELTSPYPGSLSSFRLILPAYADLNVGDFVEVVKDISVTPMVTAYLPSGMSPLFSISGGVQNRYSILSKSAPSTVTFDSGYSFTGDTFSFYYPEGTIFWNGGIFTYPDISITSSMSVTGTSTFNNHATFTAYNYLKLNKNSDLYLNADHASNQAPSVDAYIKVKRESYVNPTSYYDATFYWDESELTWTFNRGDNKYQAILGSLQLPQSTSESLYNPDGTKQWGIASQTRHTHTQTEHTLTGSPTVINFTVDNDQFSVGDVFEIIMDNTTNTITLPVALTKDGASATEYKFWMPSSLYAIAESSQLVSTLHLDKPANGVKHMYRFTLTKSWTNTWDAGTSTWSLVPNTYWSVSRYNATNLVDTTRPTKHITYDNLAVKNAMDVQDLTINGKVHVNGSVSYSVELGAAGATPYSLSDHDLNYVTNNTSGAITLYLATDPRTCVGRQHRIIMGPHTGSNHTYIMVYKQTATVGVLDHATEYQLVELTASYSSVTLMAVPLPNGVAWMPLTSSGGGVNRTDSSIPNQFP